MIVVETDRLVLRRLSLDDAGFILELLNDPGWLRFIGDRGVRTIDDARSYLLNGPIASYQRLGFGLNLMERKLDGVAVGICGLLKRDDLNDVEVGFALLPEFYSRGYAFEAAAVCISHGRCELGLKRIAAVTSPANVRSIRLIEKLGLRFERTTRLAADGPEVSLYATAD